MTVTCAVLDDYQHAATRFGDWDSLHDQVELTVFSDHLADEDDVAARLAGFDVVVIMRERTPFPASLLARLPRLKLLVTTGARNASIDLAAARERGVTVCGTASSSTPPAELTWALILGLSRHLVPEATALRDRGPWQQTIGTDLHGATLGLLGLGKIGVQVARVGAAFGMEVLAWSQHLTTERAEAAGARLAPSKEALLAASDVVSIHLVLSDRTRGLIGAGELALMRPNAFLINTSRAGIVDQAALLDALRRQAIAGAGLDVFAEEPLSADSPFRELPNVLATPHLGYVTERNYRTFFRQVVEDISAFLAGTPIREL
ncbi:D-2-hydroxyacid dehydrogenase family protein [Arthrobacter sp. zg-Y844]|uniref:D-2-hydroxyacid dehydrogenase family protein n=1 Tax=Arthrobacter sp. zg-Y844 TaxID=2964612 RepID=UPI002105E1B2|nr:D-2-hydroxyacid dehydrogenase family protein [Arthrobacter sp. zg-Y844]MCQ1986042.1 D-2-hydroxyacid dehydrogenase family protein [Arthrobacter sp. zg-Y844]